MAEFEIYVLPGPFEAIVENEELSFPESALLRVEEIWQEEFQKREGHLFNGKILQFISANLSQITLATTEYKFLLAQNLDEKLRHLLHIRPVSVSGLTVSNKKVLIGKRAAHLSTYPSYYEFAPSGTVDFTAIKENGRIDFEKALLKELVEETEISKDHVKYIDRWILVHDTKRDIFEFCGLIFLKPELSNVEKWEPDKEYEKLLWLNKEEVFEHILQHKENYVPLSLFLWKRWQEHL